MIDCTFYPQDVLGYMNPHKLQPYVDRLMAMSVPAGALAGQELAPHQVKMLVDNTERVFATDEWKPVLAEIEQLCKSVRAYYAVNSEYQAQLFGPTVAA